MAAWALLWAGVTWHIMEAAYAVEDCWKVLRFESELVVFPEAGNIFGKLWSLWGESLGGRSRPLVGGREVPFEDRICLLFWLPSAF